MTKKEREYWASIDKMLDRWEQETKNGKALPGRVDDPKPGWDHRKYLAKIYAR